MTTKTKATAVAPAPEQGQKLSRPAVSASDEELKEMRDRKQASSLRKRYGGRVKRFRVSGQTREIL